MHTEINPNINGVPCKLSGKLRFVCQCVCPSMDQWRMPPVLHFLDFACATIANFCATKYANKHRENL